MNHSDPLKEVPPASPVARALRPLTDSQKLFKREAVAAEARVVEEIAKPGPTDIPDRDYKLISVQLLMEMRDGFIDLATRVTVLESDKIKSDERKKLMKELSDRWRPFILGALSFIFLVFGYLTADKVNKFNALDEDKIIAKAVAIVDVRIRQALHDEVPPIVRSEVNSPHHLNLVNPPQSTP